VIVLATIVFCDRFPWPVCACSRENVLLTHAAAGLKSNIRDVISVVAELMVDGAGLKSSIRDVISVVAEFMVDGAGLKSSIRAI
jgi:hypothetical protein